MKKMIFIITAAVFLIFGCKGEEGSLSVSVTPSKPNPGIGEEVVFLLEVADTKNTEDVSGKWYIYNGNGVQIKYEEFAGTSLTHTFTNYGDYSVKVVAQNKKNYGTGTTVVSVVQNSGNAIDWTLADEDNSVSFKAGEVMTLNFVKLKEILESGARIDVHIVNQDTEAILFFETDIGGQISVPTSAADKGNYRLVCVVKYSDGSQVSVEDQLVLMDPNNPISLLISATQNDSRYEDTIYVSGLAKHEGNAELTAVKLIRKVFYGREKGAYPLAALNEDGGIKSYINGDFIVREEIYTPNEEGPFLYEPLTGQFEFTDPMNYYDEDGNVEEAGFKWSYAKIDREAWKSVLRKKYFSLEQAVSVSYQIAAVSETNPEEEVFSAVVKGWPYINKTSLCQIFFWYKDAALNRLWHMQCPRWCWKQTASWLLKTQKYSGLKSGEVGYTVSGFSGEGYVRNYSDWADVMIFTNGNVSTGEISLSSNQRKEYSGSFTVQTDLYGSFRMDINAISVRDMVLQYGMWTDGGASGSVVITRPDGKNETVSAAELESFMPKYEASSQNKIAGNGYDDWDDTGAGFDLLREGMSWTMFNFKYPPLKAPASEGGYSDIQHGNWGGREADWEIRYEISG